MEEIVTNNKTQSYYIKNRESLIQKSKNYYSKNIEKIKIYNQLYFAKNKERILKANKIKNSRNKWKPKKTKHKYDHLPVEYDKNGYIILNICM